jgi:PAS domain S-box-containing protein
VTRDITPRRQAADTLALTTQLFERTGELAKVGGWSVDLPTMKLSWTRETFRIAEIEPPIEPPLAEGINLFAPEARPTIAAAVQAAMETGTPYDLELPIITAKGRHLWVRTQGFGEMRDGKTVRIYGTFQDITARREAEAALRESEVKLERTLDGAHIGHWDLDLVTHAAHRSLQHDQIFGYEELLPEWTYEKFLTHVLPEDRAEVDRSFHAGVAAKTEWGFECRITRRDGAQRWIWAHGNVLTNALGEAAQMFGVVLDITARKATEVAMIESEERWRFAIEGAGDGLWDWNVPAGTVFFSRRFIEMLGFAEHDSRALPKTYKY